MGLKVRRCLCIRHVKKVSSYSCHKSQIVFGDEFHWHELYLPIHFLICITSSYFNIFIQFTPPFFRLRLHLFHISRISLFLLPPTSLNKNSPTTACLCFTPGLCNSIAKLDYSSSSRQSSHFGTRADYLFWYTSHTKNLWVVIANTFLLFLRPEPFYMPEFGSDYCWIIIAKNTILVSLSIHLQIAS